jgi:squalene-associated FAD-dependent desaturase
MSAARLEKSVAVVGGGWAGCTAALELATAGCKVTLFEAARTLGGRARGVELHGKLLDNGQHIMLGAYSATLDVLRKAGIDPKSALLTLPLQMRYPAGEGMDFVAPRLPAPLHLAAALLRAKGLAWADKLALARFSTTARWMGWQLHNDCSVSELLERFDQTDRITRLMWRPLCLAALNTPPERASAKVFLNVLRDSLGAARGASDMLLPRMELGALFPAAAAARIERHGGKVRSGAKVTKLARFKDGWQLDASGVAVGGNWTAYFDAVVLATPPYAAAALAPELAPGLAQFSYEPITTCYLQYPAATKLALPFYALLDEAEAGRSELEIAQDLDDPKKIAMTLRANAHLNAFEQKKNPANLLRLLVSALGLAIFNLFMVVPAMVYAALLATMYACALAFYVAGIAITASGLSGANELVLDGPLRHFVVSDDSFDSDMQTKVAIGDTGIHVFQEKMPERRVQDDGEPAPDAEPDNSSRVIKRAEAMAGRGIHISTDMDAGSRTTQTLFGLGMVLGGIVLFLLSLVVTKYTMVGIKRYIDMNFSLLRGS